MGSRGPLFRAAGHPLAHGAIGDVGLIVKRASDPPKTDAAATANIRGSASGVAESSRSRFSGPRRGFRPTRRPARESRWFRPAGRDRAAASARPASARRPCVGLAGRRRSRRCSRHQASPRLREGSRLEDEVEGVGQAPAVVGEIPVQVVVSGFPVHDGGEVLGTASGHRHREGAFRGRKTSPATKLPSEHGMRTSFSTRIVAVEMPAIKGVLRRGPRHRLCDLGHIRIGQLVTRLR